MAMASKSNATFGRLTLSLPSSNSIEWKRFGSREIRERSQTSSFCSIATSARSSTCVSSAENLRSSGKKMAQGASVSSAPHRKKLSSSFWGSDNGDSRFHRNYHSKQSRRASQVLRSMPLVAARLFGPSVFDASKLHVLLLEKDDHEKPLQHPRIYTLTHSDITAKITLAVAREINKAQVVGWYNKLQRYEVMAEWRKTQGELSLHVHSHISGNNFLHKLIAKFRFYIFRKELPLVLEAFMHGDTDLFKKHPELQNAPVWVYFHSNLEEYNRVECWGPLVNTTMEARLFGPSTLNGPKLRVLLLGKDDHERPLQHPRIYTLTHSDITGEITLAVASEINQAQVMGWYSKLQRDEVVAEWRKTQGEMSLHVHCHISGANFLHELIAELRFYIFQKELPLVLKAFMHGDRDLFEKHPELLNAPVWVYFHSNVEEYNRVECWGPLVVATKRRVLLQHPDANDEIVEEVGQQFPMASVCLIPCDCCSRYPTVIPIPESLNRLLLQSQGLSMQISIIGKDTPEPL